MPERPKPVIAKSCLKKPTSPGLMMKPRSSLKDSIEKYKRLG